MPMTDESIPALLRGQASQQPHAPAFTFIDYELDPAGFTETLTWSQAHQRVQALPWKLRHTADLVLVPPGSIPITTSGKIRRSACPERYLQEEFTRLDASGEWPVHTRSKERCLDAAD